MIYGHDGNYSIFKLIDNSILFNVSGGISWYRNGTNFPASKNAKIICQKHRADDSILNQSEGYISSYWDSPFNDGNYYDATAPFGTLGSYSKSSTVNANCSGTSGSGCGMYCNYKPTDTKKIITKEVMVF